ncbi:hypothetical protein WJR50_06860 [Catalinimonas sp. 4WD22]|uniref:hypothetical protein n=1 Tax=Catalinimonas locisalis TaxID=3133978 RepID=UPI00310123D4
MALSLTITQPGACLQRVPYQNRTAKAVNSVSSRLTRWHALTSVAYTNTISKKYNYPQLPRAYGYLRDRPWA